MNKDTKELMERISQPLEWQEYEIGGEKKSYPMWKSTLAGVNDTYKDFQDWFGKQRSSKSKDMSGAVKVPKAEFDVDSTTKPIIVNDYKAQIETNLEKLKDVPKVKEFEDKTGVVKPSKDSKKMPKADEDKLKKTPKVKEPEDKSGIVKPKSEVKVNKRDDIKDTKEEKSDKVLNDFVGAVKPKSEVTVNKVEEIKETKLKKDDLKDMSGVVSPKSDFGGKAKPNFDHDFSEVMEPVIVNDWNESLLDKFKKLKIAD